MSLLKFTIKEKLKNGLGRAGILETPHGSIETPAFVTVGTKATVKALTPEQVRDLGAQVVLANTYHLYFQPGDGVVRDAGGLHKFMNWNGPTMTDSGGFQAFSLGAAFGTSVSKIADSNESAGKQKSDVEDGSRLAKITEDGVTFKSHLDGSEHIFTPEKSMEIQHNLGADIMFAFDECTSPNAPYEYQKEAMERTHRWARRSLDRHNELIVQLTEVEPRSIGQSLFGIVQGGRFEDLRKESAKIIGGMEFTRNDGSRGGFDGFGIGGSFDKEDMYSVVGWVNEILPEEKPRHLLGIGEPADLFGGIENGCDLFDCVAPTRMGRNGSIHTKDGKINLFNAKFKEDYTPIEKDCECYTCKNYTRAYIAHLFRAKEMFAATLASIHNLHFVISMVDSIRESIIEKRFDEYKIKFINRYYKK